MSCFFFVVVELLLEYAIITNNTSNIFVSTRVSTMLFHVCLTGDKLVLTVHYEILAGYCQVYFKHTKAN